MTTRILADVAASITELKANPMKVATSAYGEPVAVLNRNEPAFLLRTCRSVRNDDGQTRRS